MRDAAAELSPEQFRSIGHDLVDRIAEFLHTLPRRPVAPDTTPRALRAKFGADDGLPVAGADPATIVREAAELVFDNSTFNGHPRFFGYITSSASPIGALADLLAASVNPNCGAWGLSPVATEIERQCTRWIAELLGYSRDCGGLLVSGGNMANIVCIIAAIRAKAAWNVRAEGVSKRRLAIYASSEVHTWLQKAADICGLGIEAVRSIPVDGSLAMDVELLERQVASDRAAGWQPAVVVGTAGSVSTGAIDPLPEIASLCAAESMWFHVDGAYGAPAAALADAPAALRAMALADSIAVDPHKWLYAPLEAGCALVRNPEALLHAYSFHPVYYHFEGDDQDPPTNFYEWGPQNSRGFRALKVWLTMRQVGRDGYVRMISDDIALAREIHRRAMDHPELEAFTQDLSITTFRYVPPGVDADEEYLNQLNTELLTRLQKEGRVYLSNAVIGTSFVLRACIVNFRTTSEDVAALIEESVIAGRKTHRELRVESSRVSS